MDLKEYFRETEATGLAGLRVEPKARIIWLVASTALVSKADYRHGQWLVLSAAATVLYMPVI